MIRFNHRANTWEAKHLFIIVEWPWFVITVEEARKYFDAGYRVAVLGKGN